MRAPGLAPPAHDFQLRSVLQPFNPAPQLGERTVPYTSNGELPVSVRRHLPEPAQSIYRETFNHAWDSYALDPRREEIAHRVAWSAVKRHWHKAADGSWEQNGATENGD
jgi:cation transport regulator